MSETRYTFCHICEQTCGLAVTVEDNRVVDIKPDRENPYSWRDFCVKGGRSNELLEHPRRLKTPMRRVGQHYEPATYEEAIADISARMNRIIEQHGPNAIGAYSGNPQSFSFGAASFLAGFLAAVRSHNWFFAGSVDTNAMHVVSEQMYGTPWISLNVDVDPCRCFLMIGTNPAESGHGWVGHVADGWKRVLAAQAKGGDVIVVDPRRTPTAAKANLHIAVRPGEDWAFLLGVVATIIDRGWVSKDGLARTRGYDKLRSLVLGFDRNELAMRCDVSIATIEDVARRFSQAEAAHAITRTGTSQSRNGALAEWLCNVLNAITGRIEQPGGRVLNQAPFDHIKAVETMFPPSTIPSRVRGIPPVAGAHTIAELPDEMTTPGHGQIRGFIIHGGNPVISGPDGGKLDHALGQLDLLVAIDLVQRESHRHAHWLIPAEHFLERTELHPVLASLHDEPFIQMGRAVVDRPATIRPEWEFLADLAIAMKRPLFGKPAVNWLIRGSRWLARTMNRPSWAFSPNWFARQMVESGKKVRWQDIVSSPHGIHYATKSYGSLWHEIRTPDKKIDLCPDALAAQLVSRFQEASDSPMQSQFPLQIISRRRMQNMNSWLTETVGQQCRPMNADCAEISQGDADRYGLADGQTAHVVSRTGSIEVQVRVSDRVRDGVVVLEQGWGSRLFDPVNRGEDLKYGVNRNLLVSNDELDPLSQVPTLNGTRVRILGSPRPVQAAAD